MQSSPPPSNPAPTTLHAVLAARAPGTYLLLLRLDGPHQLQVGKLGRVSLPRGWYVYVGSALGGLGARLRRHLRQPKPSHWHIDALTEVATIQAIAVHLGPARLECSVAALLASRAASQPAPRFGASDCRCPTHLLHFTNPPDLQLSPAWSVLAAPPGAEVRASTPSG